MLGASHKIRAGHLLMIPFQVPESGTKRNEKPRGSKTHPLHVNHLQRPMRNARSAFVAESRGRPGAPCLLERSHHCSRTNYCKAVLECTMGKIFACPPFALLPSSFESFPVPVARTEAAASLAAWVPNQPQIPQLFNRNHLHVFAPINAG